MFYLLNSVQVYLTNELPHLQNLRTILDRDVYTNKFPTKITVKEQLQILAEIKGALKESELEVFRRSCFGHFLNLDAGWTEGGKTGKRNTFAGQYVHFLMLRRMPTKKKRELWFLVEGKPTRFSICEFAIVTGLICTSKPILALEERVKLKARIRDEYFKSATQIKVDDIQKAFRSLCDKEEGGEKKKAEKGKKKKAEKGKKKEGRERERFGNRPSEDRPPLLSRGCTSWRRPQEERVDVSHKHGR